MGRRFGYRTSTQSRRTIREWGVTRAKSQRHRYGRACAMLVCPVFATQSKKTAETDALKPVTAYTRKRTEANPVAFTRSLSLHARHVRYSPAARCGWATTAVAYPMSISSPGATVKTSTADLRCTTAPAPWTGSSTPVHPCSLSFASRRNLCNPCSAAVKKVPAVPASPSSTPNVPRSARSCKSPLSKIP